MPPYTRTFRKLVVRNVAHLSITFLLIVTENPKISVWRIEQKTGIEKSTTRVILQ